MLGYPTEGIRCVLELRAHLKSGPQRPRFASPQKGEEQPQNGKQQERVQKVLLVPLDGAVGSSVKFMVSSLIWGSYSNL